MLLVATALAGLTAREPIRAREHSVDHALGVVGERLDLDLVSDDREVALVLARALEPTAERAMEHAVFRRDPVLAALAPKNHATHADEPGDEVDDSQSERATGSICARGCL